MLLKDVILDIVKNVTIKMSNTEEDLINERETIERLMKRIQECEDYERGVLQTSVISILDEVKRTRKINLKNFIKSNKEEANIYYLVTAYDEDDNIRFKFDLFSFDMDEAAKTIKETEVFIETFISKSEFKDVNVIDTYIKIPMDEKLASNECDMLYKIDEVVKSFISVERVVAAFINYSKENEYSLDLIINPFSIFAEKQLPIDTKVEVIKGNGSETESFTSSINDITLNEDEYLIKITIL